MQGCNTAKQKAKCRERAHQVSKSTCVRKSLDLGERGTTVVRMLFAIHSTKEAIVELTVEEIAAIPNIKMS